MQLEGYSKLQRIHSSQNSIVYTGNELSPAVVNYVIHSGEGVVFNDAEK